MKKAMLALIFGSAMFLAACGGEEAKDDNNKDTATDTATETKDPGEEIVMKSCVSCHGNELQGSVGPALNDVGSRRTEAEILDIINNGTPNGMPKGLITGADAEAAAKWLAAQK